MNYIELSFSLPADFSSEILVAHLSELGFDSFTEEEGLLRAYVAEEAFSEEQLKEVLSAIGAGDRGQVASEVKGGGGQVIDHLSPVPCPSSLAYSKKVIPTQNWNEQWERSFHPVLIGHKCCIRASFHQPISYVQYDILIEPKMAFGTGHHETTYLMAEKLMEMEVGGKSLLDMGCGTGLLAILASKMGASEILAIDNNEDAVRNAEENVLLNTLKNVNVQKGDAGLLVDRGFHVILANINRNILLRDMERYVNVLEKEGILMLSGFFESDAETLINKAVTLSIPAKAGHIEGLGLTFVEKAVKNRWCVLKFRK